jgi:hypothetical protein
VGAEYTKFRSVGGQQVLGIVTHAFSPHAKEHLATDKTPREQFGTTRYAPPSRTLGMWRHSCCQGNSSVIPDSASTAAASAPINRLTPRLALGNPERRAYSKRKPHESGSCYVSNTSWSAYVCAKPTFL